MKCNRKQITKQRARVSFWTTWLDVKSRVNVCKILTSCKIIKKSGHTMHFFMGNINKSSNNVHFNYWMRTSIADSMSIHNVSVIYLAPLKSITLLVTKRCIKARHIRTNFASFVSHPWTVTREKIFGKSKEQAQWLYLCPQLHISGHY